MANKSTPAQPEIPVATIEHEASAFEDFVDVHKKRILWGIVAALAVVIGTMVFKYRSEANFSAAAGVLTGAETIEDLRKVVSNYPGDIVAGSALLLIADKLQEEDKADDSYTELKKFVDGYKGHPLYDKGVSDLALKEQEKGNFDEAISLLRGITSPNQEGFATQNGLLRLGDALMAKGVAAVKSGDIDGAKSIFDEAKAAYDDLEGRTPSEGLKRTLDERRKLLPHLSIPPTSLEVAEAAAAEKAAAEAKKAEEEAAATAAEAAATAAEATEAQPEVATDAPPAEGDGQ